MQWKQWCGLVIYTIVKRIWGPWARSSRVYTQPRRDCQRDHHQSFRITWQVIGMILTLKVINNSEQQVANLRYQLNSSLKKLFIHKRRVSGKCQNTYRRRPKYPTKLSNNGQLSPCRVPRTCWLVNWSTVRNLEEVELHQKCNWQAVNFIRR